MLVSSKHLKKIGYRKHEDEDDARIYLRMQRMYRLDIRVYENEVLEMKRK